MTLIIATNKTVTGTAYDLAAGDSIFVKPSVVVTSTGSLGITVKSSGQIVTVAGEVSASNTAIWLGDTDTDSDNQLWVLSGGALTSSAHSAVLLGGSGAKVHNAGSIAAKISGISVTGMGTGTEKHVITNSGFIMGSSAISCSQGNTEIDITNTGQMLSTQSLATALSAQFYDGIIRFFNTGHVFGNLNFGEANDVFDGRGGTLDGEIRGLNGNDRFIPGEDAEYFDGDNGLNSGTADLLDFRSFASITVALDESITASGNAKGDVYWNIERVYGSSTGNDTIIGDAANNLLSGLGGIDTLNGKVGHDTLIGGEAKDKLTGEIGNDSFRFDKLTECGDSILDFTSNATGNNDRILIKVSAFGGGLVAGALDPTQFIIRADNVAQDANDRFIFRTSDKSLWFDANGSAAGGGLTLVADLQAAATMTSLDIVLI